MSLLFGKSRMDLRVQFNAIQSSTSKFSLIRNIYLDLVSEKTLLWMRSLQPKMIPGYIADYWQLWWKYHFTNWWNYLHLWQLVYWKIGLNCFLLIDDDAWLFFNHSTGCVVFSDAVDGLCVYIKPIWGVCYMQPKIDHIMTCLS